MAKKKLMEQKKEQQKLNYKEMSLAHSVLLSYNNRDCSDEAELAELILEKQISEEAENFVEN